MTFTPKSLCVFCGSRLGNDPAFKAEARKLGQLMAERNIELVYGGGSVGIMGVVADAVMENGGRVLGVIPDFLQKHEVGHEGLSELIVTDNMHDRKRTMFERSDGFIILPGGLGTLDETFEIMTWKQLRLHDKPIIVLDQNNYWQPFENLIQATMANGFAHEAVQDLYCTVSCAEDIFKQFKTLPSVKEEVLTSHL